MTYQLVADETGETMGIHHWEEEILKDTGGDFFFMHVSISLLRIAGNFGDVFIPYQYGDLCAALRRSAKTHGAVIRLGSDVVSISPVEGARPSVTLASGETLEADVVIAADGHDGLARSEVLEGEEVQDASLGFTTTKYVI